MLYKKDEREVIEKLNSALSMKHRSKPYNMNSNDDVKELFRITVAEYIDYQKYASDMENIGEKFDESLEYYDPLTWMALAKEEIKGDSLSIKVIKSLGKTEDYMNELSHRAEEKCRNVLKMILEQSADFQRAVWGKAYLFTEDLLDEVFEDCIEIQDTYTMCVLQAQNA